jgi:hypothetical protein
MTVARIHYRAVGILVAALAIAFTLSITTAAASARTFTFSPSGSMVQQQLPAQWPCALQRALGDSQTARCHHSVLR